MTKTLRHIVDEQPHHIVHRGNNRSPTFRDAEDIEACKLLLFEAGAKHNCRIHAYVIMTNHLHLLATLADKTASSKFLQSFAMRYARHFNKRYLRTGGVWEGRPFCEWVDSEPYFFACARYIEMNPVRANMVANPGEYAASSFRRNALGSVDSLVTPHSLYQALAPTVAERASSYLGIFNAHVDDAATENIRDDGMKRTWRWSQSADE